MQEKIVRSPDRWWREMGRGGGDGKGKCGEEGREEGEEESGYG